MILLLTEWLKGLLSISWNQKDAKEKQIVMGLSSIKFMEINYGKNCTKRKRVRGLSIRASVKKKKDASVGGDKSMSGKWILKSSRCIIVIGLLFSVTLILIVPLEI